MDFFFKTAELLFLIYLQYMILIACHYVALTGKINRRNRAIVLLQMSRVAVQREIYNEKLGFCSMRDHSFELLF